MPAIAGLLLGIFYCLSKVSFSWSAVVIDKIFTGSVFSGLSILGGYYSMAWLELKSSLNLLRVVEARSIRRETVSVKNYVDLFPVVGCVNGSFFSKDNVPLGIVISRGKLLNPVHHSKGTLRNIVGLSAKGRIEFVEKNSRIPEDLIEAMQTSAVFNSFGEFANFGSGILTKKSGICSLPNGGVRFLSFTSFPVLNSSLTRIFGQECEKVAQLDGGSSSALWFKYEGSYRQLYGVNENAYVPVMFCILRDPALSDTLLAKGWLR